MDKDSLLKNVNNVGGVNGSMLISKDGLVSSNALSGSDDPNLVGAVVSSMFTNVDTQSKRMQVGRAVRFTIETDQESISIGEQQVDGENLILYTQLQKDPDLDNINKSLDSLKG